MAIGIGSSYNESSTVEYITLNSKEDIIKAYKKLSLKDKKYVEMKILEEIIKRIVKKRKERIKNK